MSVCPHLCPTGPTGPPACRIGVRLGLSPSIPVKNKRLQLGFPGGRVTLVLGKLGGGAGRRSNGKCRMKMVEALIRAGKPNDLIVLPEQGHGFTGASRAYVQEAIRRYFQEHLEP